METLEKMIDNFNALYLESKSQMSSDLLQTSELSERKSILDEFFGRIEKESAFIRNS